MKWRKVGKSIRSSCKGLHSPAVLVILSILLLVMTGCQQTAAPAKYSSTAKVIPRERQGIVTYEINIDIPTGTEEARLWLPYPTSNEYQTIEDVKITGNHDYHGVYREGEHGTVSLYAEWTKTDEDARLTYSFKATRREIVLKSFPDTETAIPLDILGSYLVGTSLGPIVGDVEDTANEITAGQTTILGKATAIYDYIVETGSRDASIEGCGIGDVESLLKSMKGKCADISPIFVTLARAVGVPAREVFGIRMDKDGDIKESTHCRAEFYLPGYGWVPVDPSDVLKYHLKHEVGPDDPEAIRVREYLFGAQTESQIDFYEGKDITLNPVQDGAPINYFMYPYAEVDGSPLPFTIPQNMATQKGITWAITCEVLGNSTAWPW